MVERVCHSFAYKKLADGTIKKYDTTQKYMAKTDRKIIPLSDETKNKIIDDYKNHMPIKYIAKKYGIGIARVSGIVKDVER